LIVCDEPTVAGAGIVKAQSENIAVGAPVIGIVAQVYVGYGQRVAAGDPLFRLDDRALQAQLGSRQAALEVARAEVERLEQMPRPEEIPPLEAQLAEAEAALLDKQDKLDRSVSLASSNAVAQGELVAARQAVAAATAEVSLAKANLALAKADAWESEKAVARAKVAQAEAEVKSVQTELDRLLIRAPVAGEVLHVNVRPGEFVGAPASQPLVMLGNTDELHVRVDIDEFDIPRLVLDAHAVAMPKGHPDRKYPLSFVRVDPYVVPKKTLTGENTERVDTRVLQVIYEIDSQGDKLYVGQQMDVFIDVGSLPLGKRRGGPTNPIR
jgi:multidrug resistance efflux pump